MMPRTVESSKRLMLGTLLVYASRSQIFARPRDGDPT